MQNYLGYGLHASKPSQASRCQKRFVEKGVPNVETRYSLWRLCLTSWLFWRRICGTFFVYILPPKPEPTVWVIASFSWFAQSLSFHVSMSWQSMALNLFALTFLLRHAKCSQLLILHTSQLSHAVHTLPMWEEVTGASCAETVILVIHCSVFIRPWKWLWETYWVVISFLFVYRHFGTDTVAICLGYCHLPIICLIFNDKEMKAFVFPLFLSTLVSTGSITADPATEASGRFSQRHL